MSVSAKKLMRTKSKKDEQTLQELNLAHRHSQAKCQLVQTSYIKRMKFFLFCHFVQQRYISYWMTNTTLVSIVGLSSSVQLSIIISSQCADAEP